jgi:hypothetical protein
MIAPGKGPHEEGLVRRSLSLLCFSVVLLVRRLLTMVFFVETKVASSSLSMKMGH